MDTPYLKLTVNTKEGQTLLVAEVGLDVLGKYLEFMGGLLYGLATGMQSSTSAAPMHPPRDDSRER